MIAEADRFVKRKIRKRRRKALTAAGFARKGYSMTNQELNDLLARFEGSSLSKLKLSTQEFTIQRIGAQIVSQRSGGGHGFGVAAQSLDNNVTHFFKFHDRSPCFSESRLSLVKNIYLK